MSPDNLYLIVSAVFTVVIGYDVINWMRDRTITKPEIRLQRLRSKLNATALILGSTLVFASVLFHVNILRYSSPIEHASARSITLYDFKGYRLPNQTVHGEERFAFITTNIEWERNGNEIEVRALFHPSRSYVYSEKAYGKFLLQHELYHFHITEVFARKCRERLSEFKDVPSRTDIANIVSRYNDEERYMQQTYDEETFHSYILKEQKRWELKVDSLLTSLDKYKNTKIQYF